MKANENFLKDSHIYSSTGNYALHILFINNSHQQQKNAITTNSSSRKYFIDSYFCIVETDKYNMTLHVKSMT
jgi:hypothetical protein